MIKQNVCLNENSCHAVGVRYLESGKSSVRWVSFSSHYSKVSQWMIGKLSMHYWFIIGILISGWYFVIVIIFIGNE